MYKSIKLSKNNQIELPLEFRKLLNIHSGDNIELRSVEEGILLTPRKKTTEEDIIGLIKEEIPYNSVEIKKKRFKRTKMVKTKMIFVDDSFIIALVLENDEFHKKAIDYEKR